MVPCAGRGGVAGLYLSYRCALAAQGLGGGCRAPCQHPAAHPRPWQSSGLRLRLGRPGLHCLRLRRAGRLQSTVSVSALWPVPGWPPRATRRLHTPGMCLVQHRRLLPLTAALRRNLTGKLPDIWEPLALSLTHIQLQGGPARNSRRSLQRKVHPASCSSLPRLLRQCAAAAPQGAWAVRCAAGAACQHACREQGCRLLPLGSCSAGC